MHTKHNVRGAKVLTIHITANSSANEYINLYNIHPARISTKISPVY